jgi:hypothetical protein
MVPLHGGLVFTYGGESLHMGNKSSRQLPSKVQSVVKPVVKPNMAPLESPVINHQGPELQPDLLSQLHQFKVKTNEIKSRKIDKQKHSGIPMEEIMRDFDKQPLLRKYLREPVIRDGAVIWK